MSDKSKLELAIEGNTPENKRQNASEFVAPGGRGVDDESLIAPGLANNLRAAAEANERTVKAVPIVITQVMEEHCTKVEQVLSESTQRMELIQRKASGKQVGTARSICPTSAGLGTMIGFLATIAIAWFWVIPAQVAQQRGSDWAIAQYLSTPEGRAVRNHYRNCKGKGCRK